MSSTTTAADLVGRMGHDKKREGGRVSFILARGIGRAFVDRGVGMGDVEAFLASKLG